MFEFTIWARTHHTPSHKPSQLTTFAGLHTRRGSIDTGPSLRCRGLRNLMFATKVVDLDGSKGREILALGSDATVEETLRALAKVMPSIKHF